MGNGQKWARCDVIPVYRDWERCPFGNSLADPNLKQAEIEGIQAGSASDWMKGVVPAQFPFEPVSKVARLVGV